MHYKRGPDKPPPAPALFHAVGIHYLPAVVAERDKLFRTGGAAIRCAIDGEFVFNNRCPRYIGHGRRLLGEIRGPKDKDAGAFQWLFRSLNPAASTGT